jgi:integrase
MSRGRRVRVKLKGINKVRRQHADGSVAVHYYFRATNEALKGEPGTPEFLQSYAAAERRLRDRTKGTLADLIRRFEGAGDQPAAPEFSNMAETTKAEYKRKFKRIDRKWGTCPIAALGDVEFRRDVLKWRDELAAETPREADNLVSAIARVLAFAVDRAEITVNVLGQFSRAYHSDRADKIWLPEHVAAFTQVASPEMCTALVLAMHTGQRQGDLLRLPWSAYDGKRINLRQGKSKKLLSIKLTTALRRTLENLDRLSPLILTTKTGRAWKKRHFAEQWQEASEAAAITDLHFHDLRGTAVTMLAEAGCTELEIASITGHSYAQVHRILEVYLPRTRALADAAIMKLERHKRRLQKVR